MNGTGKISFRTVTDDDREFLLGVYAASREIELSMVPWDDATKCAFVEHQFDAQTSYYSTEYPSSRHDLITVSGEPVGRLYVDRTAVQISILDITILPEFRHHGIGSAILGELIEEARSSGQKVQVYVETFNPSQQFFITRGFTVEGEYGVNLQLVWRGVPI